ncbi:MAG: hypothetical protein QXI59_03190 [Candidatus Bathyarchaeia archaeon]
MNLRRTVLYFERAGSSNTVSVIEAVEERLSLRDTRLVIVPMTTGRTAQLFSERLKEKAEVIPISEDDAISACKRIAQSDKGLLGSIVRSRLEEASESAYRRVRREIFDMTFLPFCGEVWTAVKETLYSFGQGMKVAIEISVAAVETGKVKPYTKVIAVGGTGEGVDTAIVSRTSTQREAFSESPEKRLIVQEIIAMPTQKY